ncbi:DinB family protein [Paenibacillus xerothermodurans]|uniref:Damage-inducible protein DinB n=1 Tax=Paenibacillus xerothermodurans TaxID=1977292 RepID=A0A2W1NAP6_PAEXE|nr:DinB family protein [Paenibacillus xerothermodurans]PZE21477.1 hypothetical protein CBW46_009030 [Paenibacillus xerothermodurans]
MSMLQKYQYHHWATQQILDHLEEVPNVAFTEPVTNVFPSIRDTLFHIYSVDLLWYKRITSDTSEAEGDVFEDTTDAKQRIYGLERQMVNYIRDQKEKRTVNYYNSSGESLTNTLGEIIDHLVNHGTYHRGNVASALRQLGYEGKSTDYIFFLRELKRSYVGDV